MPYPNILRAVFDRPWAILPSRMEAIVEVIELRASGVRFSDDEIRERLAAAAQGAGPRGGGQAGQIAVIPVYGVLSHRINMMSEMSGGTSIERLTAAFRQALGDQSVSGIVFDVDSPGGSVEGVTELATEIRAARGQKPIVAVSNSLMASAAYWLAAQADEIVVTPSSLTGSIGIVMAHQDISAAAESEGVKVTYIYAGDYKVEGNPTEPLADEAKAHIQSLVDGVYAMFVGDVAKGRGVATSAVGSDFGQGRVMLPADAVKAGMADRVGTMDDAIARVARGKVAMRADAGWLDITAISDEQHVEMHAGSGEIVETPLDAPAVVTIDQDIEQDHRLALARARARGRTSSLTTS